MVDDAEAKECFTERREYFRVTDVLPIILKKVENMAGKKSRVLSGHFSGLAVASCSEDLLDGSINPKLVRMLCDMNSKLDLILDKLFSASEEIANAEAKEVSLSVSGVSFSISTRLDQGDLIEIKMFLPLHPPVWILLYGKVARVRDLDNDQYEVALQFTDVEDEVMDILSYYTIKRQREVIMKLRQRDT